MWCVDDPLRNQAPLGHDLSLPFTHPVLIFASAMVIFLMAPLLMQLFRLPGIVGIILAGAIVGPNGFNLLARDSTIVLLGAVGLLYLMFMAGVEIDLHGFRRHRNRSIGFGALTFLIPQGVGTIVMRFLGYDWPAAILIASMFASHTLLSYPIALRLGVGKQRAVTTAVGGTIITDTAALLVLAIIAASTTGDLDGAFWFRLVAALSIYLMAIWFGLPRLARWFFRNEKTGNVAEYVFVMAALFVGAFFAEFAGVEAIVGAFFVGLALNRLLPEGGPLSNRIHFVGEAVFIPFFLLSVGMLVDVRVFTASSQAWLVTGGMVGTVVLTKFAAAFATRGFFGYSKAEVWTIFGLTVPQAAATLAATLIGIQIGLFDDAVLNGAIAMIVFTVMIGPWAVGKFGRALALEEEEKPYQVADAPERILVPVGNPKSVEPLLNLALLLRSDRSQEPIFPLTVVPNDDRRALEYVATAERLLRHAVDYAAGADVPVTPLTRVDHNFASGIARGATETRASMIVIGWDGRRSRRFSVFGSVLDQVLEFTRQQVLVFKSSVPLNTVESLHLIVPAASERMIGFDGAAATVKRLAARLGARIEGLTVGGDAERWTERMNAMPPEAPVRFQSVPDFEALSTRIRQPMRSTDLCLLLSAREGSIAFDPALKDLPSEIAPSFGGGLVVLYPSEDGQTEPATGVSPLPPG